jgi:hypothetical protein
MIVLSNSIPKSGSTLFSWLQKDIITHSVTNNGQLIIEQEISNKQVNGIGHFVNNIEDKNTLQTLISLSDKYGLFLIKGHTELTNELKEAIKEKRIIVTFIHRDPRDILLSIIDHGRRSKSTISSRFFAQFQSIEQTIPFVIHQCKIALEWIEFGNAMIFRYQDLVSSPHSEILRFCESINLEVSKNTIDKVVETYTSSPVTGVRQYNTGKLLRYKEEMTLKEIEYCNQFLSYYIQKLGYQL